ncbi:MAG: flagellar export chaperone FlgN [Lachnospiraceae bacterium]|nr:flagellar export chaperone FlgN [Lachnospiraceae bacterium]
MIDTYLGILKDSLEKKLSVLQRIEEKSLEQTEMIKASEPDLDAIDQNMDEKLKLIDEINQLDDGFEALYQRIKEELESKKDNYKNEIKELQELITSVTEKSSSIQAIEARNKSQIDAFLTGRKKEFHHKKSAMSITRDYYQNMNKVKHVTPQFLDKKK